MLQGILLSMYFYGSKGIEVCRASQYSFPETEQVKKMYLSLIITLLMSTRPIFLVLFFSVLLLASALSLHSINLGISNNIAFNWFDFGLLLIVFLSAHAAVNLRNEIDDSRSGLDMITTRTPFSGGTGGLLDSVAAINLAEKVFWILTLLVVLSGIYFIFSFSLLLIPLGLVGLVLIYFYTTHITAFPWLCWFAAGLGFGPIMLFGAFTVLIGSFVLSLPAMIASLIVFIWVNNLLLLNQIPDIHADRQIGRFNLWMRYGIGVKWLFYVSQIVSVGLIYVFAQSLQIPLINWALLWGIAMLWMVVYFEKWLKTLPRQAIADIQKGGLVLSQENLTNLRPILAMNVIINLLLPLSLALLLSF
ncbi:1,4-dihydroxy-2-naphthoate octaprenyltransferase [uncultured Thiomicrorhabdus sp.]